MFRAMPGMSDVKVRSALRERRLAMLLATHVARRRGAADLALSRGDVGSAATLEEAAAMAAHRLGLFEDAMLAIVREHGAATV